MSSAREDGKIKRPWYAGSIRWAGICLALSVLSLFTVDYELSRRIVLADPLSSPWHYVRMGIDFFRFFGELVVAVIAVGGIALFDPSRRNGIVRIGGVLGMVYFLPLLLKSCCIRYRPTAFFLHENFSGADDSIWQSFGGLVPGGNVVDLYQSFPSGHSSLACGLAVVFSLLYPRWRYALAGLACLVMFQRLSSGAHFSSDIFFGAFIGIAVARFSIPSENRL